MGEAAKRAVGNGGYGQSNAQIPDMNSFPCSIGVNGWARTPSDLMIQWGQADITYQGQIVTLPIVFPHLCLQVVSSDSGGQAFAVGVSQYSNNRLRFQIDSARYNNGLAVTCRYIAVGY